MAGKTKTGALQTAMQGGKVTDKAAQSALTEAVGRIASLTKRAHHSKEAMIETGTVVMHTAETQGSLFLASMAEGYLGDDKLKIGAVDLRGPLGLLAQGYGLYQTMTGQKGAGAHVLAVGNGLIGSLLASIARNAGQTLAEKRAGAQTPPVPLVPMTSSPSPVVMQGLMAEPGVAGPMREVLLTPGTEGDEVGRGRHPRLRRRIRKQVKRRMERREQRQEAADDGGDDDATEGEFGRRRRRFVRAERDDDPDDLD
jgi:hypothetical protein